MIREEFLDCQYKLSVCTEMNQRYHQSRASVWSYWDRGFKIAVAILSTAGAVLAFATLYEASNGYMLTSVAVAVSASLAGILLNVFPFSDWQRDHVDLFRRWTDLREEIDVLLFEVKDTPNTQQLSRLTQLEAKYHRICGAEPPCKEKLLKKCQQAAEAGRNHPSPCAA